MSKVLRYVRVFALAPSLVCASAGLLEGQAAGGNDAQTRADVSKALSAKRYNGVKATVQNGVVTLSGTVDVYRDKEEAGRKVTNNLEVAGGQREGK